MSTSAPNPEAKKEKKTRDNVAAKLGLAISNSRVNTCIKKSINDPATLKLIKDLDERIKKAESDKKSPDYLQLEKLKEQVKQERSKNIRIAAGAPMAVTALLDNITKDIFTSTFDYCQKLKKPTTLARPIHMYDAMKEKPVISALLMLSESFEKCIYKDATVKKEEKVTMTSEEKKKNAKQGFKTYIMAVIKAIKKENPNAYDKMRVTDDLKDAMNKFVKEIIVTLAKGSYNMLKLQDVHTITRDHVMRALEGQMEARHQPKDKYEYLLTYMKVKTDKFKDYKKMVKDKKDEENKSKESSEKKENKAKNEKAKNLKSAEKKIIDLKSRLDKTKVDLEEAKKNLVEVKKNAASAPTNGDSDKDASGKKKRKTKSGAEKVADAEKKVTTLEAKSTKLKTELEDAEKSFANAKKNASAAMNGDTK